MMPRPRGEVTDTAAEKEQCQQRPVVIRGLASFLLLQLLVRRLGFLPAWRKVPDLSRKQGARPQNWRWGQAHLSSSSAQWLVTLDPPGHSLTLCLLLWLYHSLCEPGWEPSDPGPARSFPQHPCSSI